MIMVERRNFGKGDCPEPGCKSSPVNLTAEGVLRVHGPKAERCPGSGAKPKAADSAMQLPGMGGGPYGNPDVLAWADFRALETEYALQELGEIPGHGTSVWANGVLEDEGSEAYGRAALVAMAGSLDKLSPKARAMVDTVRRAWATAAGWWADQEPIPADPNLGPNPHRAPLTVEQQRDGENGTVKAPSFPPVAAADLPNFTKANNPQYAEARAAQEAPAGPPWDITTREGHRTFLEAMGNSPAMVDELLRGATYANETPAPQSATTAKRAQVGAAIARAGEVVLKAVGGPDFPVPTSYAPAPQPGDLPGYDGPAPVRAQPDESKDFDQWRRYKIPDPTTGTVQGWQRVTTFAKSISDQWGLAEWQQRVLLKGAAMFPAMVAGADRLDVKRDAKTLNAMAETVKNAAGAGAAALHGTTVHTYTEHMDAGLMDDQAAALVPAPIVPDLIAYGRAMADAGLFAVPELIESTIVHRDLQVAGRLDRVLRTPAGDYVIGDVKTGQDLSYGWLDIIIQLACYAQGINAHGVFDWGTRTWGPAPKVRTDYGIVMHIPAGQGTCQLYRVDLDKGWAAAALAKQVVATRKTRKGADIARPLAPEDFGIPELKSSVPGQPLPEVPDSAYGPGAVPLEQQGWTPVGTTPAGQSVLLETRPDLFTPEQNARIDAAAHAPLQVQPPSLPGLEPSRPAAPAEDGLGTFRQQARDAMWAAFKQGAGGQAAVYETALSVFPAGDRIFRELEAIGRGEPPF